MSSTDTPTKSGNRVSSAFIVLIVLLFGLLWYLLYTPIDITPQAKTVSHNKKAVQLALASEFRPKPITLYTETNKRPLFNPDRRPFKKKPIKVAKPKPVRKIVTPPRTQANMLRLLGVLIDATTKKALIGSNRDKKGQWLSQDMTIDGWKVVSISDDGVILKRQGKTRELKLYSLSSNDKK